MQIYEVKSQVMSCAHWCECDDSSGSDDRRECDGWSRLGRHEGRPGRRGLGREPGETDEVAKSFSVFIDAKISVGREATNTLA